MLSHFCLNELDGYSMQDVSSSHTSITNLQREEVSAHQLLIERNIACDRVKLRG